MSHTQTRFALVLTIKAVEEEQWARDQYALLVKLKEEFKDKDWDSEGYDGVPASEIFTDALLMGIDPVFHQSIREQWNEMGSLSFPDFQMSTSAQGNDVEIYSGDSGSPDDAVVFVEAFLKHVGGGSVTFQYSYVPRSFMPGEFGGGAMYIEVDEKGKAKHLNVDTGAWVLETVKTELGDAGSPSRSGMC